jgi:integrase
MTTVRVRRPGEGAVFQAKDGRWVARARTGPGRRLERRFAREADAVRQASAWIAEREANRPMLSTSSRLDTWARRWVEVHPIRESSRDQYRAMLERFVLPELGAMRLRDIRRIHVEEALARVAATRKTRGEGTMSASTVAAVHRVLCAALTAAVDNDLIATNVALRVKLAEPDVEVVAPSPDECERILEALAAEELAALFLVLRWTGCRIGEARGLRWSDVGRGTLTFARQVRGPLKNTTVRRPIPVPDHVLEAIARMPRRSLVYVFTTRTGQPLDNRRIERILERALEGAGIRTASGTREAYTPHSFRHAFAAELLRAGFPESYVMTLLGHSSITTTVHKYGHLKPHRGFTRTALADWFDPRAEPVTHVTQSVTHGGRR